MCRLCLRDLFVYGKGEALICEACKLLRDRHPDRDPSTIRNGRTERLPQERPFIDRSWVEVSADAPCASVPSYLFEPITLKNQFVPAEVQQAAKVCCARCPILERCRAIADAHEFEGVWGGQLRYYRSTKHSVVYTVRDLLDVELETAA